GTGPPAGVAAGKAPPGGNPSGGGPPPPGGGGARHAGAGEAPRPARKPDPRQAHRAGTDPPPDPGSAHPLQYHRRAGGRTGLPVAGPPGRTGGGRRPPPVGGGARTQDRKSVV